MCVLCGCVAWGLYLLLEFNILQALVKERTNPHNTRQQGANKTRRKQQGTNVDCNCRRWLPNSPGRSARRSNGRLCAAALALLALFAAGAPLALLALLAAGPLSTLFQLSTLSLLFTLFAAVGFSRRSSVSFRAPTRATVSSQPGAICSVHLYRRPALPARSHLGAAECPRAGAA